VLDGAPSLPTAAAVPPLACVAEPFAPSRSVLDAGPLPAVPAPPDVLEPLVVPPDELELPDPLVPPDVLEPLVVPPDELELPDPLAPPPVESLADPPCGAPPPSGALVDPPPCARTTAGAARQSVSAETPRNEALRMERYPSPPSPRGGTLPSGSEGVSSSTGRR
jgi:hypothetical protein